jgi:23S rRNA (guanosine2251-2'-O)-methyltransferase
LDDNNVLIYGRHPVADAIRAGKRVEKVLIQQGMTGEAEIEIRRLCREHDVVLSVVPKEKLSKLVQGNHQGIIAIAAAVEYESLHAVLPQILVTGKVPLLLLLDGVTDVRNFGAIVRSAEVAGVDAVVVPQKGSAIINADAIKAAAGAFSRIPICREKSLSHVLDYLGEMGVRVFASHLKSAKMVFESDFTLPTAILMGSEGEGVNPAWLKRADEAFRIPQVGTTDSFNVSVATGIILYEVMRQRFLP